MIKALTNSEFELESGLDNAWAGILSPLTATPATWGEAILVPFKAIGIIGWEEEYK